MTTQIPEKLLSFLDHNKVATVCLVDNNQHPYCINCFYAFDQKEAVLIFKSSFGTKHETLIKPLSAVSGTILPDKIDFTGLKGIQFSGTVSADYVHGANTFNGLYAKTFPMSLMLPGYFWKVSLQHIKFTDNSAGFGNKTIWQRSE